MRTGGSARSPPRRRPAWHRTGHVVVTSAALAASGVSFAAVDFEIAARKHHTACAVGVAVFDNGAQTDSARLMIQPPGNAYDPALIDVHGITPADTANADTFPRVWGRVASMTDGRLLVAHNAAFDMSVLRKSADHHRYRPPPVEFVCTEKLARVAAPEQDSYRLDSLAAEFGLPLTHHDPLSDAVAAGLLWLLLLDRSGLPPEQWLRRCGYRGAGYCRHGQYQGFIRPRASSRPSRRQPPAT